MFVNSMGRAIKPISLFDPVFQSVNVCDQHDFNLQCNPVDVLIFDILFKVPAFSGRTMTMMFSHVQLTLPKVSNV